MIPFSEIIFGTLLLLISYQYKTNEDFDRKLFLQHEAKTLESLEYDFIIVGGGSAGCVAANRLSEKFTVLLLEAGGDPVNAIYTPLNWAVFPKSPDITYRWLSKPQKFSGLEKTGLKLNKQFETAFIPQGKSLGGTSNINAMIYNRGHPKSWDKWAEITGDPLWKYENLLEYFKKIEKHEVRSGEVINDHLGYNGSLNLISNADLYDENGRMWISSWGKSGVELGYEEFNTSNGPQIEGFGPQTQNIKNGRRVSAFDAFLKPLIKTTNQMTESYSSIETETERESLKIERYAEVRKIIFDDDNKAIGVLYKRHGINKFAKVSKEIILSAGSLNSPKILMNSGIGPEKDLTEAGIPVRVNLPVGKRFQGHPILKIENFGITKDNLPYSNKTDKIFEDFERQGKGPLTLSLNNFAQAFIVSQENRGDPETSDWPDIQLYATYDDEILNGIKRPCIFVQLVQPSSYGSVQLNITNPLDSPLIWNPNFFESEKDVRIFREGLQISDKIFRTQIFKDLGVTIDESPIERCSDHSYGSDMYWNCLMNGVSSNYPASTCPMGKVGDEFTVVDSKLRVIGVKRLRVMDNSIQPKITNANLNSNAMLIGEIGSQFLIDEYNE